MSKSAPDASGNTKEKTIETNGLGSGTTATLADPPATGTISTPSPLPIQPEDTNSSEEWEDEIVEEVVVYEDVSGSEAEEGEEDSEMAPIPSPPSHYPSPTHVWINLDDNRQTSDLFRNAVPEGKTADSWFEELSSSVVRMLYPTLERARFPGPRTAWVGHKEPPVYR